MSVKAQSYIEQLWENSHNKTRKVFAKLVLKICSEHSTESKALRTCIGVSNDLKIKTLPRRRWRQSTKRGSYQ